MYVLAASAPPVATNSLLSIVRHWISLTCQLLLLFVFFFSLGLSDFILLGIWSLFAHPQKLGLNSPCCAVFVFETNKDRMS